MVKSPTISGERVARCASASKPVVRAHFFLLSSESWCGTLLRQIFHYSALRRETPNEMHNKSGEAPSVNNRREARCASSEVRIRAALCGLSVTFKSPIHIREKSVGVGR